MGTSMRETLQRIVDECDNRMKGADALLEWVRDKAQQALSNTPTPDFDVERAKREGCE